MDGASFFLFLAAWAKAAQTTGKLLIEPYFDNRRSNFPVENLAPGTHQPHENIVVDRYVFDSKAIQKLRQQVTSERAVLRVVAVSTFLAQALLVPWGAPSRHNLAAHQYSGKNCPVASKARFWHVD